jgi:hypothetical protein
LKKKETSFSTYKKNDYKKIDNKLFFELKKQKKRQFDLKKKETSFDTYKKIDNKLFFQSFFEFKKRKKRHILKKKETSFNTYKKN